MTTAATTYATTRLPTVHHRPVRSGDITILDAPGARPVPTRLGVGLRPTIDELRPARPGRSVRPGGGRRRRDDGGHLGRAEPGGGERLGGPLGHPPGLPGAGQGDGAAAEAGPGHARPHRPRVHGRGHGRVELGRRHLVVVAQGGVGGGQQRAQPVQVAGPQQRHRLQHPGVLGHHVAGPAQPGVAERLGGRLDLLRGGVAQGGDAEDGRGRPAGGPPVGVGAVDQPVAGPGVDHHQAQPGRLQRQRDLLGGQRPGVEEQGVPGPAEHRHHLVHHPRRHPDDLVLGPAGQPGQGGPVQGGAVQVGQGGGGGALQGGARRQPRPGGHVPVDHQVGPAQLDPGLAERPRHPGRVGGPALDPPRPHLGQGQVGRGPGLQRPQPQPAVPRRPAAASTSRSIAAGSTKPSL